MNDIKLDISKIYNFVDKKDILLLKERAKKANIALHKKTGLGNDFLGWVDLPNSISQKQVNQFTEIAEEFKSKIQIMIVIGIGGSYLGAKAVIEALSSNFDLLDTNKEYPKVLFAGQNICEDYLYELIEIIRDKSYAITVISKSGTTTEPALAFRLLKGDLEKKYGKTEAQKRIIAITDKEKGALKQLAEKESYRTFVIPDDVGGRYSVLTPVGLLAIAIAGFDIKKLIEGAKIMREQTSPEIDFEDNIAEIYATVRNLLYQKGKTIEILVNYNPKLHFFAEWWKQLYGESEGKSNKGIFPASVDFSSDLHSMGQYIQDGIRNLFETVISIKNTKYNVKIPFDEFNLDNLNYISNKNIDNVNKMAELGTMIAHVDGGVPNIKIEVPRINEFYLGKLIYFFEKACGISGYMLGVNPFDQEGVEAYKRNMFALLGKPGFEEEAKKMAHKVF